jgi:type II secretory pathway component PulL
VPPPKNTDEILANNIINFLLNLPKEQKKELYKRFPFLTEDKKKDNTQED